MRARVAAVHQMPCLYCVFGHLIDLPCRAIFNFEKQRFHLEWIGHSSPVNGTVDLRGLPGPPAHRRVLRHRGVPAGPPLPGGADAGPKDSRRALAIYLRDPVNDVARAFGLLVLTLTGDKVSTMTRFDNAALPAFGLPRTRADLSPRHALLRFQGRRTACSSPSRPSGPSQLNMKALPRPRELANIASDSTDPPDGIVMLSCSG
jgi:hypothetical protein